MLNFSFGECRPSSFSPKPSSRTGHLRTDANVGDDGDRSPLADPHRPRAPDLLHGVESGVDDRALDLHDDGVAAVERGHLDGDPRRRDRLDVRGEQLGDLLRVLIGNEAHRHLGAAPGGEDGLRPLPHVAAEDAVDVAGRPRPGALAGGVPLLAEQRRGRRAPCGRRPRPTAAWRTPRAPSPRAAARRRRSRGSGSSPVLASRRPSRMWQRALSGFHDRAAEGAGVEVPVRAGDLDLQVASPFRP